MPVFYRDNMYRKEEDRVFLKLYNGKDWVWQEIFLKKTDLDYIRKNWSGTKAKSPVLIKKHRKYFLQFAFEQEAALTERAWNQYGRGMQHHGSGRNCRRKEVHQLCG